MHIYFTENNHFNKNYVHDIFANVAIFSLWRYPIEKK
jgi:hypothetical protein